MGEIKIRTDILVPDRKYVREFTGDNPSRLMSVGMQNLMKDVFRVQSSDCYEDSIKWDNSGGDTVDFYGIWRCRDSKDARTKMWVKIVVQGRMSLRDKTGTVTVSVVPVMETILPYTSWIDKLLTEMNYNMFYKQRLQTYIAESKRKVDNFDLRIREIMESAGKEH